MDEAAQARRDFGLTLIRTGRRWRQAVDAELKRSGLTAATWRPLFYLGSLGDGLRLKDLAEALDVERPSLGQLIDRLERDGLVERRGAPDDRRGKTLHLTDAGRAVYERTVVFGSRVAAQLTTGISDTEIATCTSVFRRLTESAHRIIGGEGCAQDEDDREADMTGDAIGKRDSP
jgi:MarR family transcriptional regulator, transcriptional regulator for hemolysin